MRQQCLNTLLYPVLYASFLLCIAPNAWSQIAETPGEIAPVVVDLPAKVSLDDLRGIESTLDHLRQKRLANCGTLKDDSRQAYQLPETRPSCDWDEPIPQSLLRAGPGSGYGALTAVYPSPYHPYELRRYQNGLSFFTLVPEGRVVGGHTQFTNWRDSALSGKLAECSDPENILNHPGRRIPDNVVTRRNSGLTKQVSHSLHRVSESEGKSCLVISRDDRDPNLTL
jgi:hypothetical protein